MHVSRQSQKRTVKTQNGGFELLFVPAVAIAMFFSFPGGQPRRMNQATAILPAEERGDWMEFDSSQFTWIAREPDFNRFRDKHVLLSYFSPYCSPSDIAVHTQLARSGFLHDKQIEIVSISSAKRETAILQEYADAFANPTPNWSFGSVDSESSRHRLDKIFEGRPHTVALVRAGGNHFEILTLRQLRAAERLQDLLSMSR